MAENEGWSYMEIWCFRYIRKDGTFSYKYEIILLSKKQRWSSPNENTPKDDISNITEKDDSHLWKDDIGILDWHSSKSSNDSLYFYRDLFRCFTCCFPMEKPGTLIYRLKVDFMCKLYGWRYSTMKNRQYSYHSALRSSIWRSSWTSIKENICPIGDGL